MKPRTPLTFYGGKQRLASQIVALMPPHRVYLEPFAGGAAVLFAKSRAPRETLNDLDGQLMRFWRVLRERPDELVTAVTMTPYSRAEWSECRQNGHDGDVEAARRLVVSIAQSFSGEGSGWSPPSISFDRRRSWHAGVWQNMPPKLAVAATRLSGVALECKDAIELISHYDQPDAVIYCDPPYIGPARRALGKGYDHEAPDLWPRLVEVLARIEHAAVLLSGYPNDEVEALGWRSVALRHTTLGSMRPGSRRRDVPEMLWLSPNVPDPVLSLFDGRPDEARATL